MKILGIIVFGVFVLLILFLFCAMFIAKISDEEMEKFEKGESKNGFNKTE